MVCPNCKEVINTDVRESITHWMQELGLRIRYRLPFMIGLYAVIALVLLLIPVNTTFKVIFCIAGITVVGIFYVMSHILNGKT